MMLLMSESVCIGQRNDGQEGCSRNDPSSSEKHELDKRPDPGRNESGY